jgi:formylmethanofuran dehydrogenase subunit A
VFFTTDHPNGAPFTAYPELFRLLMDRDYRNRWLSEINAEANEISLLRHLDREYDYDDIAIMTRAAPARLLGLPQHGHLGIGANADIAVYSEQDDKAAMFGRAHLLFKDGVKVVEEGRVVRSTQGRVHAVAPAFDQGIESALTEYFDRYHLVNLHNFKLSPEQLHETLGSELVLHRGAA